MVKKSELQAELDRWGIDYPARATKAELQDLIDAAYDSIYTDLDDEPDPEPEAVPVTEPEDTSTSGEAVVNVGGLCRQCRKPADHIHRGV